jgi:hypothetical protein
LINQTLLQVRSFRITHAAPARCALAPGKLHPAEPNRNSFPHHRAIKVAPSRQKHLSPCVAAQAPVCAPTP